MKVYDLVLRLEALYCAYKVPFAPSFVEKEFLPRQDSSLQVADWQRRMKL